MPRICRLGESGERLAELNLDNPLTSFGAVCINQDDNIEKRLQTPEMHKI